MSKNKKLFYEMNDEDSIVFKEFRKSFDNTILLKISEEFKQFLYENLKINLNIKDEILLSGYLKVIERVIFEFAENSKIEVDLFFDIKLPINTELASYMVSKIQDYVKRLMDTNSKNILYGTHKEKWGGIDGDIVTNRKDIAIKIIKFVKSIRRLYPYISSRYVVRTIGFELSEYEIKGLNNYKSMNKYIWIKKTWKNKYKKRKSSEYDNFIKKYKSEYLDNRKKTIKKRIRRLHYENLI